MPDYIETLGTEIDPAKLQIPKAIELAKAILSRQLEYVRFIECRNANGKELVIFDVEAELSQTSVYPIEYVERIAVTFSSEDNDHPEVHALREDFPRVPHLNLRDYEKPRSLCLYEQRYCDIKKYWTAKRFIERIREWLKATAKGELHQDDQPLEPLLIGSVGTIVLPNDFQNPIYNDLPDKLYFIGRNIPNKGLFLIANRERPSNKIMPWIASVHKCNPVRHGVISRRPTNLKDLAEFTSFCGLDLLSELREKLKRWFQSESSALQDNLIIVLHCPKIRKNGSEPEEVDILVFFTDKSIGNIGVEIGIYQRSGETFGLLLYADISKQGENIALDMLNPHFHITREQAAWLNGLSKTIDKRIVCIGAGALGSQIINNMAKSGSGIWTIIDDDIFLPHNVSRHVLSYDAIGLEKADAISNLGNNTLCQRDPVFRSISCDLIEPKEKSDEVKLALSEADIIIDITAPEITVSRYISYDIKSAAKRLALFLNPRGTDLVLLCEGLNRNEKLADIEMQYYRALLYNKSLSKHLELQGGQMRYGQSCRDVTFRMPQDFVALHAAIASLELKKIIESKTPCIVIWQASPDGSVQRTVIPVHATICESISGWEIKTDFFIIKKLFALRKEKIKQSSPVETGGVLLGSIDMERKIIYIVDTIPAPADSVERPLYFERGITGLRAKVSEAGDLTLGNLEYIGEWHSHTGSDTRPSEDDKNVFSWMDEHLGQDGLPATMLIVGESSINCMVGKITYSMELKEEK